MIKLIKENFYRVWYNPYGLDRDEEDFMEVTAETEEEASRRVRSKGYVTSVEEIDHLTDTYDESKTRPKRNRLMEESNFDDTYLYTNRKSRAMEKYLRDIYVDDIVSELDDALEKEGFDIYDEDVCSLPADCNYVIWQNDTYQVTAYYNRGDSIVSDIYVKSSIKESISRNRGKKLREQDTKIEVKHEGILEVPEGKNVDDLPVSHFVNLAKKKGLSKITKALNNLQVWNKNDDPKLSKWAGDMIDKVSKKMEKNEAFDRYNPNVEADFMEPGNLYNDMPDEPYDNDVKNKDYFDFVISDVLNRCRNEHEARRYMKRNGLPNSFIDDIIAEIDRIYDEDNYEEPDLLYKYESLNEADYGYVHDEEEAKLSTSLRSYLRRTGWIPLNIDGKSYFEMDFNYGNEFCSIYVDEWGNCYLTTDGDDLRPFDMFYTITETNTNVIDDLITLGNTITSTGDVSSALDVFFG